MRFLLSLLVAFPFLLSSQTHNMQLLSTTSFPDNCADVWGYADSAGREYAFVGRVTGTSVMDVTDPTKPVSLQFIPGAVNIWREIKTYKNRAYVTTERGQDGLLIINMSQAPSKITWTFFHPQIVVDDKTLGISKTVQLNTAHDLIIDENGICYLFGSNVHQGILMLDLNKNPDIPQYLGIFNPNYSHGGFVRKDTFWSADIFLGDMTIWDLKDKSKPKKIANQRTGNAFTHSIALSDDNKYAFTTDERANAYLEGYKVDNLSNITFTDRYRSYAPKIRNTIPHNIFYYNGFVATAYYTDGFTIVDATDPTQLVEVGAFDTYPNGDGDFHGCWGVYPYLPSGNILASDIEFGLYIVKPTYVHASYIKGIVKDSITGATIDGANIRIDKVPFYEVLSTTNGTFKSGGPYTGVLSIIVSKSGYDSKTVSLNVQTGKITNTEVLLHPSIIPKIGQLNIKVVDAITKIPITNAQTRFEKPNEAFIVKTLQDGTNQLALSEGTWTIRAGAWGYKYATTPQIVSGANQSVTIELTKGYEDNFVFDFGWTASSTSSSGIWGRVVPIGTYKALNKPINPAFDLANDFGEQCMVTGNNPATVITDDVDGGYTRLLTPEINLTNINKPVLNFNAWTAKTNVIDTIPALGNHKVYIASGGDTILIDTISSYKPFWTDYHFNLDKAKIKNLNACTILFEAFEPANADSRNLVEFGVDGFSISDGISTAVKTAFQTNTSINAYPNPWTDYLTIVAPASPSERTIQIIHSDGIICYTGVFPKYQESLTIHPDLHPGLYFIRVLNQGKITSSMKIVKLN